MNYYVIGHNGTLYYCGQKPDFLHHGNLVCGNVEEVDYSSYKTAIILCRIFAYDDLQSDFLKKEDGLKIKIIRVISDFEKPGLHGAKMAVEMALYTIQNLGSNFHDYAFELIRQ